MQVELELAMNMNNKTVVSAAVSISAALHMLVCMKLHLIILWSAAAVARTCRDRTGQNRMGQSSKSKLAGTPSDSMDQC